MRGVMKRQAGLAYLKTAISFRRAASTCSSRCGACASSALDSRGEEGGVPSGVTDEYCKTRQDAIRRSDQSKEECVWVCSNQKPGFSAQSQGIHTRAEDPCAAMTDLAQYRNRIYRVDMQMAHGFRWNGVRMGPEPLGAQHRFALNPQKLAPLPSCFFPAPFYVVKSILRTELHCTILSERRLSFIAVQIRLANRGTWSPSVSPTFDSSSTIVTENNQEPYRAFESSTLEPRLRTTNAQII